MSCVNAQILVQTMNEKISYGNYLPTYVVIAGHVHVESEAAFHNCFGELCLGLESQEKRANLYVLTKGKQMEYLLIGFFLK